MKKYLFITIFVLVLAPQVALAQTTGHDGTIGNRTILTQEEVAAATGRPVDRALNTKKVAYMLAALILLGLGGYAIVQLAGEKQKPKKPKNDN